MRQVAIYSVLLAAAMVGAYVSWTAEESPTAEGAEEQVAIYNARKGDVKKLAFDSEKLKVAVERRNDARGDYVWVTVDETKEKVVPPKPHDHGGPDDPHGDGAGEDDPGETPDEGTPDDAPSEAGPELPAPEPTVEMETTHLEFLGNDAATGLFESFEPLMALRELKGDAGDPKAFGLETPEAKIVVSRSAGDTEIDLGGETYGAKDRYARQGGRMLLIEDTTVRPLQFAASRLIERRVHPLVVHELDRVEVQSGGRSLGLIQRNKDDRQAAFWARQGDEDTKDDTAATWIDKLMKLKASEYPTEPDLSGATQSFTVTLVSGSATWAFEILEDKASGKFFARSEFNRTVVELTPSLASEAVADIGDLFEE